MNKREKMGFSRHINASGDHRSVRVYLQLQKRKNMLSDTNRCSDVEIGSCGKILDRFDICYGIKKKQRNQ